MREAEPQARAGRLDCGVASALLSGAVGAYLCAVPVMPGRNTFRLRPADAMVIALKNSLCRG